MKPALLWSLLLPIVACRAERHTVRPGGDEVEVVAHSTTGYGCIVPPFVTAQNEGACASDRGSFVLTDGDDDPAAGPPGRYHLVGRWADAPSSYRAWAAARGEAVGEGAPSETIAFPRLHVRDWCVEAASVPRAYREPSSLAPASAPWRAKICR